MGFKDYSGKLAFNFFTVLLSELVGFKEFPLNLIRADKQPLLSELVGFKVFKGGVVSWNTIDFYLN